MAKGIVKQVKMALNRVNEEISDLASRGGRFSAGVAGEGYVGGYADALRDVLLALNGVRPNRRGFWETGRPADD